MNAHLVKVNNVIMQGVKGLGLQYSQTESKQSLASKVFVRKMVDKAHQNLVADPLDAKQDLIVAYQLNNQWVEDVSFRYTVNQLINKYADKLGLTLPEY